MPPLDETITTEVLEMPESFSTYMPLIKFFSERHNLALLPSEVEEIIWHVREFDNENVEDRIH